VGGGEKLGEPFSFMLYLTIQNNNQTFHVAIKRRKFVGTGTMMSLWSSLTIERKCDGSFAYQPTNLRPALHLRL